MYKSAKGTASAFMPAITHILPQAATGLLSNLTKPDADFLEKQVKNYFQNQAKKYTGSLWGDAGLNLLRAAQTRGGALTGSLVGAPLGFFMTPGREEETLLGTTKYRSPTLSDRLKGALTGAAVGGLGGGALGAYGLRQTAKGITGKSVNPVDLESFTQHLLPGEAEEKSLRNFIAGHARTRKLTDLASELASGRGKGGGGGGIDAAKEELGRRLRSLQEQVFAESSTPIEMSPRYMGQAELYRQLLGQAPGAERMTEAQLQAAIDSLSQRAGKGGIKHLNEILGRTISSPDLPMTAWEAGEPSAMLGYGLGGIPALLGGLAGGAIGGVPGAMVGGTLAGVPASLLGRMYMGNRSAAREIPGTLMKSWMGQDMAKLPPGILNLPSTLSQTAMSPTSQSGLMNALKMTGAIGGATALGVPAAYGAYRYMGYGNPEQQQEEAPATMPDQQPQQMPAPVPQAPVPQAPPPQAPPPTPVHPDINAILNITDDAIDLYQFADQIGMPWVKTKLEALRRQGSEQYNAGLEWLRQRRAQLFGGAQNAVTPQQQ
jgi:hypothetical protein